MEDVSVVRADDKKQKRKRKGKEKDSISLSYRNALGASKGLLVLKKMNQTKSCSVW
jgi:hypothetical protein